MLVGCAQAASAGGNCRSGAMGAGFAQLAGPSLAQAAGGSESAQFAARVVVGGTASRLGGGSFVNGAYSAAFGYLFNYLSHSRAAGPYVERLRAGSAQAGEMLDAMAADPNTNYYIDVGPVPESAGGGTTKIQQPSLSLWDRLLGRSAPAATVIMTVDVSSQVQFTDVGGQSFRPSAERILAHELGHGYSYLLGGYTGYRINYDAAIRYEKNLKKSSITSCPESVSVPSLLEQVGERIRFKHYSIRTGQAYVDWIKRFIRHFDKRPPKDMGAGEVQPFLTHLALAGRVAASTQKQARSALSFLDKVIPLGEAAFSASPAQPRAA